jgi:hypothetical protein
MIPLSMKHTMRSRVNRTIILSYLIAHPRPRITREGPCSSSSPATGISGGQFRRDTTCASDPTILLPSRSRSSAQARENNITSHRTRGSRYPKIRRTGRKQNSKVGSKSYFALPSQPGRIRPANPSLAPSLSAFLSSSLMCACPVRLAFVCSDLRIVGGPPRGMGLYHGASAVCVGQMIMVVIFGVRSVLF